MGMRYEYEVKAEKAREHRRNVRASFERDTSNPNDRLIALCRKVDAARAESRHIARLERFYRRHPGV